MIFQMLKTLAYYHFQLLYLLQSKYSTLKMHHRLKKRSNMKNQSTSGSAQGSQSTLLYVTWPCTKKFDLVLAKILDLV